MSRKLAIILLLIIALSSSWVAITLYHKDDIGRDFNGPLWLFNFGPAQAPDFLNFIKVSGQSIYTPSSGFGWLNLRGDLKQGRWTATSLRWESAENFNAIMRPGPDALASSYITGPTTFVLDVDPGKYDVWILTGDMGLLEYVPYQSYRIEVNGEEAFRFDANEKTFYKTLDTPSNGILNQNEIYGQYVEPYFKWKKITVDVTGGKLKVRVDSKERDPSLLKLLGEYPHSEQRSGPEPRFGGALNAMIVARSGVDTKRLVENVDNIRRRNFLSNHPEKHVTRDNVEIRPADSQRGYNIFYPEIGDTVLPTTVRAHEEGPLKAIAARGEYIPLTFALASYKELGKTKIVFPSLMGPNGAQIGSADIKLGQVSYAADPVRYGKMTPWQPLPGPIIPFREMEIKSHTTHQYWITIHVPENAVPGNYAGNIRISPVLGASIEIPVRLKVLPFRLKRPTQLATGLTYFVPVMDAYFDKSRFWQRIRQEFADMRQHNMTTVQLTGMGLENYEDLDKLFSIYKEAGFEQPVYFLESAAKINLVKKGRGFTVSSKKFDDFCDNYLRIIRQFTEEQKKRGWPDIIIDFGDEFTNIAKEEVGEEIAKRLQKIPGIVTGADVDGAKELRLLAPHVSILSFNEGWNGPTKVNKGKRQLVHAGTVNDILRAGATPWLVNIGKDRFSNGYYFWKMSRVGLKGKIEWIYRDYRAMPHNPFAGRGSRAGILDRAIYPGPGNTILTTIPYERMRQGLDDLAYLYTLKYYATKTSSSQLRKEAEALLGRINHMVDDDFSHYSNGKRGAAHWTNGRYYELRNDVSNMILKLWNPSSKQPAG